MKSLPLTLGSVPAVALVLLAGTQGASAATQDSKQISSLLNEAMTHAVQAEDDATALDSFTRSAVSWKLHTYELDSMKLHVNELGRIAAELQDLEPEASEWQKQAIHQVIPLLRDMAGNLTKTIQHLNENQSQVHMPAYRDYTRTNFELAKRTAELIRDFVAYDEARSTAESLETKLELARQSY